MSTTARPLVVLDAPSNLGLRPPEPGSVPGCTKAPWALRERGLVARVAAVDGGCVVPPRYRSAWTPGEGDRNGDAIASCARALADRLDEVARFLRTLTTAPGFVGMEVTIFDPDLDPDAVQADRVVSVLEAALGGDARR